MIKEGRKEMFYLMTHLTHFISGYIINECIFLMCLIIKEGNVYLTTHSTHFIYRYIASGNEGRKDMFLFNIQHILFIVIWLMVYDVRRKEMFYLTMHSAHFIYGYMASDIW